MKEIRFHARGKQGALTAAEILVQAAILEGKYASALPISTSEKLRQPLTVFLRLDDKPIREKTQVYQPDGVVVMDVTLFPAANPWQGLKPGGVIIMNGSRPVEELNIPQGVGRIGLVEASRLAYEMLASPVASPEVGVIMLGALVTTTGWLELESVLNSIREYYPPDEAERRVAATKLATECTQVIDLRTSA